MLPPSAALIRPSKGEIYCPSSFAPLLYLFGKDVTAAPEGATKSRTEKILAWREEGRVASRSSHTRGTVGRSVGGITSPVVSALPPPHDRDATVG